MRDYKNIKYQYNQVQEAKNEIKILLILKLKGKK